MTRTTHTLLNTKVLVNENERALILKNGQFDCILMPGKHALFGITRPYAVLPFSLSQPVFSHEYADALLKDRADIAEDHLTVIDTDVDEVAVISRDGRLYAVQRPEKRSIFWTDAGPWTVERLTVAEDLAVPAGLAKRLLGFNSEAVRWATVDHGQVGLRFVDGALTETLKPGVYANWHVGRSVTVRNIDLREHALDVTGQEILTNDRVSIRVNLAATYKVTDPVKAVTEVKDFHDSLYRALQHAFRQTLATKTLDEILAKKGSVDTEAAKGVSETMSRIGLEVSAITIKDVVLPGEMRDILNTVVTAQKEAEANVIRRREETAATRSLLNTAKLMEDNPAMLRLKELEALETIADKVGSLTVHNGTQGLLEDLVSLKAPGAA